MRNHANVLGKHVLKTAKPLFSCLLELPDFLHQLRIINNRIEMYLQTTVQQRLSKVGINLVLQGVKQNPQKQIKLKTYKTKLNTYIMIRRSSFIAELKRCQRHDLKFNAARRQRLQVLHYARSLTIEKLAESASRLMFGHRSSTNFCLLALAVSVEVAEECLSEEVAGRSLSAACHFVQIEQEEGNSWDLFLGKLRLVALFDLIEVENCLPLGEGLV